MNKLNILHISPDFNYTCGVSKYLTIIFKELIKYNEINLYFATNRGDSLDRIRKLGIEPIFIPFEKGIKNIFYLRKNLKALYEFCKNKDIKIIHTHHRYPEFLANKLKVKLGIRTVTTVHSLVRGWKYLSFKSDIIIAVSNVVKSNILKNYQVSEDKIIHIYNPIESDDVDFHHSIKELKDFRVILFVGRNDRIKGLDILIRAFIKLSKEYDNLALVIVSDLSDKEFKKLKAISSRIFPYEPVKDLSAFYNSAEIVVLPSRIESFPYVMLEAGLYKKLFLGSNVDGIGEFINDGINGFLFQRDDFNKLIQKLDDALNLSSEEKKKIIENLYLKTKGLNSPEEYVERLLIIYKNLIN